MPGKVHVGTQRKTDRKTGNGSKKQQKGQEKTVRTIQVQLVPRGRKRKREAAEAQIQP